MAGVLEELGLGPVDASKVERLSKLNPRQRPMAIAVDILNEHIDGMVVESALGLFAHRMKRGARC